MLRVLLASGDKQLVKYMEKELQGVCAVATCHSSKMLPETLREFDPDVVMLDTQLPGENVFAAVRGIRQSFRDVGIVALSALLDDCTVQRLAIAGVNHIVSKPCKISALVSHILEVGGYICGISMQDPEFKVNSILLDLGFRMGLLSYQVVKEAVLVYGSSDENVQMKNVYYQVMKLCGGTSQQKEKALRDGIKNAVKRGDPGVWKMYFPPERNGEWSCPTNEEFVARISACLRKGGRLKLPYENDNIAI